ncbi:MAG: BON domain-containing protein [Terriglobales bacterium]|jgi:hypothetical protein
MRSYKSSVSIALLTLLASCLVACSKHPNDDAIAKDIQTKVAANPDTKGSNITVAAHDGKVTLSGTASTPAVQQRVEQIAREEPGAAGVDDQIAVQPAPPTVAEPVTAAAEPAPDTAEQTPAAAAAAPVQPAEAPKPPPPPIVVPAGTTLTVKMGQALSSKTSQTGQSFTATLSQSVRIGGKPAIPAGSSVLGNVLTAKEKGKIKGQGELTLALVSITVAGQIYKIQSKPLENTIKGKGKRTAATTGGGAAVGALIGGIAGGGKGAAIGAGAGGGAGFAGGALTGNQQIEIAAGSALSFHLAAPLTLPPSQ